MALARRLEWSFVDTDRMVVEAAGVGISRMVEMNGWSFFRRQEHLALKKAASRDRRVVGTGGGIVLDDRNIALMRQSGKTVWLTASERTIAERMQKDRKSGDSRPALTGLGPIAEIRAVLAERRPRYAEAADLAVDTDRSSITDVCERIAAEFGI